MKWLSRDPIAEDRRIEPLRLLPNDPVNKAEATGELWVIGDNHLLGSMVSASGWLCAKVIDFGPLNKNGFLTNEQFQVICDALTYRFADNTTHSVCWTAELGMQNRSWRKTWLRLWLCLWAASRRAFSAATFCLPLTGKQERGTPTKIPAGI